MLITPKKAFGIVLDNVHPLKSTRIPLNEATGFCLAEQVRADRDLPPMDRSAMDGYAVRSADIVECPSVLQLGGEVAAGSPKRPRVRCGTCVRILTGANVPPGADSVVKVEDTAERNGQVSFLRPITAGANIRRRGEEVRKSKVILDKGTVLGPAQIGLCASVGKAMIRVTKVPRIAVMCTGEELLSADASVRAYQLRDSNGPALCAGLKSAGFGEVTHQIIPDTPNILTAKLKSAAAKHDVIILTGGVSVGKYDFVPDAVKRIGATVRFHGVAMKPGKPQLYATLNGNRHIFCLPGNPLSVLVGFGEFVLPALRRMSGLSEESCRPSLHVPLFSAIRCKGTRSEFVLGRLVLHKKGSCVRAITSKGSADLVAGAKADGVIVVPQNVRAIPAGELVEFRPWRAMQ